MASATLRPGAVGLRAGIDDTQQHVPSAKPGVAVCGVAIRPDPRNDRPDWPRCLECGMVVRGPSR